MGDIKINDIGRYIHSGGGWEDVRKTYRECLWGDWRGDGRGWVSGRVILGGKKGGHFWSKFLEVLDRHRIGICHIRPTIHPFSHVRLHKGTMNGHEQHNNRIKNELDRHCGIKGHVT